MAEARVLVAVIIWASALWRTPAAIRAPAKRPLWLAFTALALALTASVTTVRRAIDHGTGVTSLTTLIMHLCGVVAAAAVLDGVHTRTHPQAPATSGPQPRHLVAAVAALTLSVLFGFIPRRETTPILTIAADNPAAAAYEAAFAVFLGTAMVLAARMFGTASRAARTGPLRIGLWLLTAGMSLGTAYAVIRIAYLASTVAVTPSPGADGRLAGLSDTIELCACALIAVGSSIPATATAWQARRNYRDLNALRPLWNHLVSATPDIVLGTPPSRLRDRLDPRDLRLRLIRRTIEIRDSALQLRAYTTVDLRRQARARLAAAGLAGDDLNTAVEACWLQVALTALDRGASPGVGEDFPTPGGADFASEIQWLRRIATASTSDLVRQTAADLTTTTLPLTGQT